jgi:hypothetical protein
MKNSAKETALKIALTCIGRFNKRPKLDMRFNFNKQVANELIKIELTENEETLILRKRADRRKNKFVFSNVLNNPLVIDYKANKSRITHIHKEVINFDNYRNHWAKNEFDLKVIAILKQAI